MNWSEFFNMGGYALYVWSSWGLTLVVFAWHIIQAKQQHRKIKNQLKRHFQRQSIK